MSSRMRSAHQTIQTKMIEKFGFPTGVPKRPVRMISEKKNRFGMMSAN
jgi:hypothetical protein